LKPTPTGSESREPLRIAFIGVTPTDHGGVPYAATQTLLALAERGVQIECFVALPAAGLPIALCDRREIALRVRRSWWQWSRWYSRTPLTAMLSGLVARSTTQCQLAVAIVRRHRCLPFDAVYQFGPIELQAVGLLRRHLPPIVLHPGVHAAGELRWHRREAGLARQAGEPLIKRGLVRALLAARTAVQGRDMRRASLTIAVSEVFARDLVTDYRIDADALAVVPYPVDLERFSPGRGEPSAQTPVTVVFVAAMSVRKGVEMIVELSHRLADLADEVRLELVGAARQWSDYRPLLDDLNSAVAHWHQELEPEELARLHRRTEVAVQPSHYEPGAIAFLEVLASGIPVVASEAVGPSAGLDETCCRRFPAGDMDAFEASVRKLVADIRGPQRSHIRHAARSEAERYFSRQAVGAGLVTALERVAGRPHGVPEP